MRQKNASAGLFLISTVFLPPCACHEASRSFPLIGKHAHAAVNPAAVTIQFRFPAKDEPVRVAEPVPPDLVGKLGEFCFVQWSTRIHPPIPEGELAECPALRTRCCTCWRATSSIETLGIPAMDLAKRRDLIDGMYNYVRKYIVYLPAGNGRQFPMESAARQRPWEGRAVSRRYKRSPDS